MEILPYVYCIKHKPSGYYYVGMRHANKRRKEDDLMRLYFTSSANVKRLIERDGVESMEIVWFVDCDSIETAHDIEHQCILVYHKNYKVLNAANGKGVAITPKGAISGSEMMKKSALARKGDFWITNGIDNKRVKKDSVIPDGWERGRTVVWSPIYITNGSMTVSIPPGYDIPNGWYIGHGEDFKKLNSDGNKGKKWYNNGITDKKFYPGEEPDGWSYGRIMTHDENSRQKIAKAGKGRIHNKGRVHYNNGEIQIALKDGEAVPDGFTKGRLSNSPTKGKKLINNGTEVAYIEKNDEIPKGWVAGRIK